VTAQIAKALKKVELQLIISSSLYWGLDHGSKGLDSSIQASQGYVATISVVRGSMTVVCSGGKGGKND
jgi:hypothetical protein